MADGLSESVRHPALDALHHEQIAWHCGFRAGMEAPVEISDAMLHRAVLVFMDCSDDEWMELASTYRAAIESQIRATIEAAFT